MQKGSSNPSTDKPDRVSEYGPGGRKCFCCGPSPKDRGRNDRAAKRRMRRQARKEVQNMLYEHLDELV